MLGSLNSGISGLQQFQGQMEVIGNNIANVNTTGYKASRIEFVDTFSQSLRGASNSPTAQVGSGVATGSVQTLYKSGAIAATGQDTDLAVEGQGFFMVRDTLTNAQYATRAGGFKQDKDGYMVNSMGLRLQGYSDSALSTKGDLKVDPSSLIAADIGTATVLVATKTTNQTTADAAAVAAQTAYDTAKAASDAAPADTGLATATATAKTALDTANNDKSKADQELSVAKVQLQAAQSAKIDSVTIDEQGKINVFLSSGSKFIGGQVLLQNFTDPQALVKEGNNLYSGLVAAGPLGGTTPSSEAPGTSGLGKIRAGSLEMSNVDLTSEFTNLISAQRAFQASARIITTSDELMQEIVSLKR